MNEHNGENRNALSPELLAAYSDGELTPAECCRVEAWLAEHPEARKDVEAQRRLARLFQEATPAPPGEERWADALAQVERCLTGPTIPRPAGRRRAGVAVGALVAAAAAVLFVLARPEPPPRHLAPVGEEVWPVASADDIEIVSMDDRDRGALVVGEPPVNGPMELLTDDEVKVQKLPDGQGRVGRLHVLPGPGGPQIVVSLGFDPDEDP